ncbi:MAG: CsgG/HfaB family protein [Elusimicrobiota bacterium]
MRRRAYPTSRRPRGTRGPLGRAALAALLVLASGCMGPEVTFNKRYEFSRLRRVAVSRFDGPSGEAASDFLTHALLGSGADVVERSRLESLLAEQRLSGRGALDPTTVKRIGKILGVDGIFIGNVTKYTPAQSYLVYTGSSTVVAPPVTSMGEASRFSRTTASGAPGTDILTSSAQVGLTARLVDVETGSVVWSAHQSYEGFDTDSAMSAISTAFARTLAHLWGPR